MQCGILDWILKQTNEKDISGKTVDKSIMPVLHFQFNKHTVEYMNMKRSWTMSWELPILCLQLFGKSESISK